ncbi:hypothetical protein DLEV_173 [Diachasmimorpha longicaudata entomopoxvirus]|uniref:Uncharacterized protein n=1 Tax=Diachasmimorpha longicaudata entomopoxvirus TaxID=109981 RepID=A0A7R5WMR0_9POXV|nr:hypothetical protein QKK69_gp173 [Diachasmimorpha longicaudata entomopoxvirus]AKS26464.1 hypothetical protein DLEV_173 [Diachasmimorpha longicaudata entomopoxvirus]
MERFLQKLQYAYSIFSYDKDTEIHLMLLSGQIYFQESDILKILNLPMDFIENSDELQIFRKRDMFWYISEIGLIVLLSQTSEKLYKDFTFSFIPSIKTTVQTHFDHQITKLAEGIQILNEKINEYEFNIELLPLDKLSA